MMTMVQTIQNDVGGISAPDPEFMPPTSAPYPRERLVEYLQYAKYVRSDADLWI